MKQLSFKFMEPSQPVDLYREYDTNYYSDNDRRVSCTYAPGKIIRVRTVGIPPRVPNNIRTDVAIRWK